MFVGEGENIEFRIEFEPEFEIRQGVGEFRQVGTCGECGALVTEPQRQRHVDWHFELTRPRFGL